MGSSTKSLYDTDFVEWTTCTADQLRRSRLAGVDPERVAEEIEDLGKGETLGRAISTAPYAGASREVRHSARAFRGKLAGFGGQRAG
jgi:Domain of unknown function DUF29